MIEKKIILALALGAVVSGLTLNGFASPDSESEEQKSTPKSSIHQQLRLVAVPLEGMELPPHDPNKWTQTGTALDARPVTNTNHNPEDLEKEVQKLYERTGGKLSTTENQSSIDNIFLALLGNPGLLPTAAPKPASSAISSTSGVLSQEDLEARIMEITSGPMTHKSLKDLQQLLSLVSDPDCDDIKQMVEKELGKN